jgi:addiction module HigA family antidote
MGFRHRGIERFFAAGTKSGIQAQHADRLRLILGRLNVSTSARDMNLPGLDLHELRGARKSTWAVKVSGNRRVTFTCVGKDVDRVDYEDYVAMKMHNPPHPGEVLRQLCLEPLNLTVTDAARSLGVSRKALSSIVNGRAGISPEMAVRLSIAFNTSAESWLNQQLQYDLWHAEKNRTRLHVARLSAA